MITSLTATAVAPYTWQLDFASDLPSPTFYLYRNGVLILTTTSTSQIVSAAPGESPVYDVLDDSADTPSADLPATVTVAWYATAAAGSYRIEQYVDAAWSTVQTIADDGRVYYRWDSEPQPDGQTAQFRVTPVGANGNDGTPQTFSVLVVRYPDPPQPSFTYSATDGTITLA